MYLSVEGWKSANQFVGHVLSDEWSLLLCKGIMIFCAAQRKGCGKSWNSFSKMRVGTEKELKEVVVDYEKEYDVSEPIEEAPSKV